MFNDNVCIFVPYRGDCQSVHTVNFVLETKAKTERVFRTEALYKAHYALCGSGFLHTMGAVRRLERGDVFFTFAGTPYFIESQADFQYAYVSFLGSRANMIMEKLHISPANPHFHGYEAIEEFWISALSFNRKTSDLASESVLLYTFSAIGDRTLSIGKDHAPSPLYLRLKKYVDDNYTDPDLSLSSVGAEMSYNAKYLSAVFKKNMGVGISEYITAVRVQCACTLIGQGLTCVSEIAALSGYRDALYFSKAFKKRTGLSPKNYIADRTYNNR